MNNKHIHNYNIFLNENIGKEFKNILHNIKSYFNSEDDIEKLETDLIRLLNNYKFFTIIYKIILFHL